MALGMLLGGIAKGMGERELEMQRDEYNQLLDQKKTLLDLGLQLASNPSANPAWQAQGQEWMRIAMADPKEFKKWAKTNPDVFNKMIEQGKGATGAPEAPTQGPAVDIKQKYSGETKPMPAGGNQGISTMPQTGPAQPQQMGPSLPQLGQRPTMFEPPLETKKKEMELENQMSLQAAQMQHSELQRQKQVELDNFKRSTKLNQAQQQYLDATGQPPKTLQEAMAFHALSDQAVAAKAAQIMNNIGWETTLEGAVRGSLGQMKSWSSLSPQEQAQWGIGGQAAYEGAIGELNYRLQRENFVSEDQARQTFTKMLEQKGQRDYVKTALIQAASQETQEVIRALAQSPAFMFQPETFWAEFAPFLFDQIAAAKGLDLQQMNPDDYKLLDEIVSQVMGGGGGAAEPPPPQQAAPPKTGSYPGPQMRMPAGVQTMHGEKPPLRPYSGPSH